VEGDGMTERTDTQPLRAELEKVAASPEQKTLNDLHAIMRPEIEKLLGSEEMAERAWRVYLTEERRTPKLMECSAESRLGALMLCAQLGLEPGPLGQVYLVPFKKQVEFIVGYRGYVDLAYRSGMMKSVVARLVYEKDAFKVSGGTTDKIVHEWDGLEDRGEIVAAYALAKLTTGGQVWQDIYESDWERARKASASGSKGVGPWNEHRPAMIRKTAVRRLEPMLPKSPLFAQALERDEAPTEPLDVIVEEGETL
jgi:recombination protein RecT